MSHLCALCNELLPSAQSCPVLGWDCLSMRRMPEVRKASEGSFLPLLPSPPSLKRFAQVHRLPVPAGEAGRGGGTFPQSACRFEALSPRSSLPALSPDSGRPCLAGFLGFPSPPVSVVLGIPFLARGICPCPLLLLAKTVAVTDFCSLSCAFHVLCSSVKLQTFRPQVSQAALSCPGWVPSSL